MQKTYSRGDMYYANLGKGVGSEQEGYRPVVIIQNNVGNRFSPTVIIAAISNKVGAKPRLPTHYFVDSEDGLELPSIILMEQLRTGTQAKKRPAFMQMIEDAKKGAFDLIVRGVPLRPQHCGRAGHDT